MHGDELISYGFKRIVEELKRIVEELIKIRKVFEKIEQNTFTASGEAIKQTALLEKIENAAVICQCNTSGLMNDIRKMSMDTDGGLEKE